MSDKHNGGPVFPQQEEYYTADPVRSGTVKNTIKYPGMSLRDFFASKANEQDIAFYISAYGCRREVARYKYADDMLKEREK